jgi:hypothetical protein
MKNIVFMFAIIFLFSGCSVAQKTSDLGKVMMKMNHPLISLPGLALSKVAEEEK